MSRKLTQRKSGLFEDEETSSEIEAFNMRSYSQQSNNADDKQHHRSPVKLERKPALRLQNSLEYEGIHLDQNPDATDDDLFDAATVVLPGEFTWIYFCLTFSQIPEFWKKKH